MNIVDWFSDLVGIVDDAQDVSDIIQKDFSALNRTVAALSSKGKLFADNIRAASRIKDPKDLIKFIKIVEGSAPLLWKDLVVLSKQFDKTAEKLENLEKKVQNDFPMDEARTALSLIRDAKSKVRDLRQANTEAIKVYSDIQEAYNQHLMDWRATLAAGVVADMLLTAGFATIIMGIVKGAQEGRIIFNTIHTIFLFVVGIVKGIIFVLRKIGQAAAAAVRGGHKVMVETAKVLGVRATLKVDDPELGGSFA